MKCLARGALGLCLQLAPQEVFLVLGGGDCAGPYAWREIDYRGAVGWIAEGFEGQYFTEPWLPG